MKNKGKSLIMKALKGIGIAIVVLFLLLFLLPAVFPEALTNKVKAFANKKLNGELSFQETHLSFFSHFPSLTLTLDDFLLLGSAPFEKDTLVVAQKVAFEINVKSIFLVIKSKSTRFLFLMEM
jgi:AsmA protein